MSLFNTPAPMEAAEDLLDREFQAIVGGNLEALTRLLPEKTRLMERLRQVEPERQALERLRQKAERNQALLEVVGHGIRSVSQRLQSLQKSKPALQTYDRSGARQTLERGNATLKKKL